MLSITESTPPVLADLDRLKASQQKLWGAGDFSLIARHTVYPGEVLTETVDVHAGQRVLDVATGSGNVALSAARRGADVVGLDYVRSLLTRGRQRAAAEHLSIEFREGDCESIPFADESFDVVLSVFGAMFAPNHQQAADEIVRVTRTGGKIGNASWTPEGFWGQVFRLRSRYLPPPTGVIPATAWGNEDHLYHLFGDRVTVQRAQHRIADFRHRSVDEWLEFFGTYFGPMVKALEQLSAEEWDAFRADLRALAEEYNRADDGTLIIPAEYLETVLIKR